MRASAKYIWIFLLVAFVGGFLFYESSGLFGRAPITTSTAVATVNGDEILYLQWQQAIRQLEQQETQSLGRSLTLDEQDRLADRAFDQLVESLLMDQEIRRRGISVTSNDIIQAAKYNPPPQMAQSPELQTNGQFDYEKYLRFLNSPVAKQSNFLQELEAYYRAELPKQIFYEQIVAGIYPSDAQLWAAYRDVVDSAQVSFAAFRPGTQPDQSIAVSDEEIRAYYDKHKKQLTRPGRAVVTYTYVERAVTAADSAAVRDRALALRARIVGGEKFEDVARTESADTASGSMGGDLSMGTKGRFVPEFENAAAALAPGQISQPVLTRFGYHLIRIDSRTGDSVAMHHILLRVTQSDSAASRTDRRADSLSKIAANADKPQRFDSAVKLLKLPTARADVYEGEPLVVNGKLIPSVSAWAFRGIKPGETSEMFDDDNGYYIARLESVTPGGEPSIDQVKNDIRAQLVYEKTIDKLMDPAQKFATAAKGPSLEQAGQVLNTPTQQSPLFARVSNVPGLGQTTQAVGAAFTLPIGQVSAPVKSDDGVYVMRVDRRKDADRAEFEARKNEIREQQIRALQQARIREYMAGLKEQAKIKDRRKEIRASERRGSA